MASQDVDSPVSGANAQSVSPAPANAVEDVAGALAKVSLQDQTAADVNSKPTEAPPRPLKVYTRQELLYLSKSSLVTLPTGMPLFKDWFGCVVVKRFCLLRRRNEMDLVIGMSKLGVRKNPKRLLRPTQGTVGMSRSTYHIACSHPLFPVSEGMQTKEVRPRPYITYSNVLSNA